MDFTITIDSQIAEAKRELAIREQLYPKWIATNRMRRDTAEHGTATMRAILHTLMGLKVAADVAHQGEPIGGLAGPRREYGLPDG